ncbi:MAG: NUDIX hydrolase [uncultured bacterium]|nr:NUDIX hydrolase [candidate division WWE3 bacterium RAAC2_WWE3_1]EKD95112.1 MAG: NUDIX hydrolase [uncultured bacterium]KKS29487.1 MAG: NUDIX hydrolase [candidate division WWE3 bacterium GW2011_GWB1_42_117]KKS54907.1 MAG: NUDIX hydrolase [candidate division WWE3 bacterium GW2011_GWD2_42_34]KKT05523.1 MAG: NUDIX hydrolase [candidate division WWE3 bacterium GW2011_GWE2_43_18]KKT06724.1 MAG: NUDIX hydrolase [candidate division WWE3 bacterium GW2011_GWF2_43_18]KKT08536.1 MAG: NUDIX hydrolase [ca
MNQETQTFMENAVAAIRVSSVKQGVQGDSPEAQKEQIERYAEAHNIHIKKFFIFLESASKDEQPVQEAIDYCKSTKNNIQVFIIKSIDRFTRGGSFFYEELKMQLEANGVKLIDIYGVIGQQQVNTLEHLGVSFKWSVYSPTKKAEMLEAERAKDEMRDIMSRMIGAEIRYSRMGYWVRKAPMGFMNDKIETPNGKRTILKPHPVESTWIIKMFDLRCRGTLSDHQIVEEVNNLGFRSRVMYFRDHHDRTKIIKEKGGKPLNIKGLWSYLKNPLYAGINLVNWTKDSPHKGKFEGLVPIEMFNKANRGKIAIIEEDGEIKIERNVQARYQIKKGVRNPDFPYKRVVMCPCCNKPLFGSASKGRLGKYYPAYHCNKRGHYFRVPKKDFDDTVEKFVRNIKIAPGYTEALVKAVVERWEKRETESQKDKVDINTRISELQAQAKLTADKIRFLTSEVAIKYVEADLVNIDQQIAGLLAEKEKTIKEEPTDIRMVMAYIKYFLEHLEYLLIDSPDPVARASYFGVLFDTEPTYQELVSGTQKKAECIKLNEVFVLDQSKLAAGPGFEPGLPRSERGRLPLADPAIEL